MKCPAAGETAELLGNEATFYEMVRQGGFETLEASVPEFVFHDPADGMLVLELCSPAVEGFDLAEASLEAASPIAASIGRVLAACHAKTHDDGAGTLDFLPNMSPWAFNITRPTPELFRTITPLHLQILRAIGSHPSLEKQFDRMRRAWNFSCLTHGDIRWENFLATKDASGEFNKLQLIDWEGVGYGDPAWDVAGVFSAYMGYCLSALPLDDAESPQAAAVMFADRMPNFRRPMREMWNAYVSDRVLDEALATELLNRAVLYSGLRLLQFAFEWGDVENEMPRFVLCSLQLAVNLLTDTDDGRVRFLVGS